MDTEKYQVLKELALEFVNSKDPSILEKIIKKVDKLLFYTIYKARRSKPYLKKVELQDLYQTAIIGLYRALLKVKEDEPGSKLVYKIGRYTGNEIAKDYKRTDKVTFPFSIADVDFQVHLYSVDMPQSWKHISQIEDKLVEDTLVYKNLEMKFIRERFLKLIEEEIISFEEFEMLVLRFVEGMTYTDIARQFGTSQVTISKKIGDALNRLRYEFRRRGWEGM